MPEGTNTSGDSTATVPSSTPATGTPATASAMQQKPSVTLEEALARLTEAEHSLNNAKEENARHSKKLSAYEKAEKEAEAAKRAAEEAQLSEIDKATKRAAAAEAQIQHYREQLVMAQVKLAAKDKNIIDPDLAALAIKDQLELDADGMPTNLDKALESLVKHKPYLVRAEPAQALASPAQTTPTPAPPAVPAMNPGRSNIAPPGSNPPGRIPRLSDPGIFKAPGTASQYQP